MTAPTGKLKFAYETIANMEAVIKKLKEEGKAIKDLLYVVDGMCECYRNENFGDAREWARHVNDAYTNYEESKDEQ